MNKSFILFTMLVLFFTSCKSVPEKSSPQSAPIHNQKGITRLIDFKDKTLDVEIAATSQEKAQGLMHRKKLGENKGMLFIYPSSTIPKFWMKNTHIPLSVAFIDSNKRIVQIEDLTPHSLEKVSPHSPIRFAVEVNQGWFKKNGITVNDFFRFSENR